MGFNEDTDGLESRGPSMSSTTRMCSAGSMGCYSMGDNPTPLMLTRADRAASAGLTVKI